MTKQTSPARKTDPERASVYPVYRPAEFRSLGYERRDEGTHPPVLRVGEEYVWGVFLALQVASDLVAYEEREWEKRRDAVETMPDRRASKS